MVNNSKFHKTYFSMGLCCLLFSVLSCKEAAHSYDATGAFEADETIISSEASGVLKEFNLDYGQQLRKGEFIGFIDSTQLVLKKKQLQAQLKAVRLRKPNSVLQTSYFDDQIALLETQWSALQKEKIRTENLVKANAAPAKQLDDIVNQLDFLKKQLDVTKAQKSSQLSNLGTMSSGLEGETEVIRIQIEQLEDQLSKCAIINPVEGTVLTKYVQQYELIAPGKPLYKIADMTRMYLKAYLSANQYQQIKLDQKIKVRYDDGQQGMKETEGVVVWINSKAEFTPKTIQTKDERANLVYAVKLKVPNDGTIKIGMYGELIF